MEENKIKQEETHSVKKVMGSGTSLTGGALPNTPSSLTSTDPFPEGRRRPNVKGSLCFSWVYFAKLDSESTGRTWTLIVLHF